MESWQKIFLTLTSQLEKEFDKQKFNLKKKMDWIEPLTIQAYRGYASQNRLYMKGRVLEEEGIGTPSEDATVWQNLRQLYYQFESDEIPHAKLSFKLNQLKDSIQCNDEGFFEINLREEDVPPLGNDKWAKIQLSLNDTYNKKQDKVEVDGEIMIQHPSNQFGLISDLDDTIIVSKATDFLEKMRIMLLRNASTRKPFEGVGAFYRALEAGPDENCQNPIFYVSSSSWHLYEMFDHYCKINNIPKGVFLLRELGIDREKFIQSGHGSHKLDKIKHVLTSFKDLPFVLIGDSGQKDPEIYREVVKQFPGRIKVIYIRDVKPEIDDKRDREVKEIAAEVKNSHGVEMRLVQDSMEAAKHAVELGLIKEEALESIDKDTYEDRSKPSDISQLLGLDKLL